MCLDSTKTIMHNNRGIEIINGVVSLSCFINPVCGQGIIYE